MLLLFYVYRGRHLLFYIKIDIIMGRPIFVALEEFGADEGQDKYSWGKSQQP